MGRTVLITGASGALGPPLLAELLQSDEIDRVVVLLRPGPRWDRRARRTARAALARPIVWCASPATLSDRILALAAASEGV